MCGFDRVFEGKRECKQDEREQGGRENKIVFHPKAYNSALYLKIDAGLKKEHQSKHQKCFAVTGKSSLFRFGYGSGNREDRK